MGRQEREMFADRVCELVREWIMDEDVETLRAEVADGRNADLPENTPEYLRRNTRRARTIRLHVNGGYLPATTSVLTPDDLDHPPHPQEVKDGDE